MYPTPQYNTAQCLKVILGQWQTSSPQQQVEGGTKQPLSGLAETGLMIPN